jgi:nucleoside-diphosphate-sugar epimerase
MKMGTQTILGSGGVIGDELAKSLKDYGDKIRLVSRNPVKVNSTDELVSADLTNRQKTSDAVKGSQIVYLTVGLPYKIDIWQKSWPLIMSNVINACKEHAAKLVFFDNVYLYGKVDGWMTEETPVNPCSNKGEVRAKIAEQLMNEAGNGNLQALIARSADFYGLNAVNTMVHMMVFEKFKNGKKASWVLNDKAKHSMTYTPDAGRATAVLGNTPEAYNQVWHLPTDRNALTGEQFIEQVAKSYGVEAKYSVLGRGAFRTAALFNSLVKESMEMLYQLEYEYLFDSTKFEKKFFQATSYEKGIREIADRTSSPIRS